MEGMKKHRTIPITASAHVWRAAGFNVYEGQDEVNGGPHGFEKLISLAMAQDLVGDKALAWAMTEQERRYEAQRRDAVESAAAAGTEALANAIRGSSERELLERILGRLSERTQYAVRQQLAGR